MRRGFALRRPVLFCIGILLAAKVAFIAVAIFASSVLGGASTLAGASGTLLLMGGIAFAAYKLLPGDNWAEVVGFNRPARWREPWLLWLPALYILVNLGNLMGARIGPLPQWPQVLDAAVRAISVPVVEETVFRGLILAVLLRGLHQTRRQVLAGVALASVLFGLWHLPPSPGTPWQQGIANVIYTVCFGIGFAAVVLRTRAIWLNMLVHGLIVFANAFATLLITRKVGTVAELIQPEDAWRSALLSIAVTVPLLLYGLWLLRNFGPRQLAAGHRDEAAS